MPKPLKKLLASDIKLIEEQVRLWPLNYKNTAAQLILHSRYQKDQIEKLEREIARLRAPELAGIKKNAWVPTPEPEVRGTFEQRVIAAFDAGIQGSPSFLASLARHGKTLVEAEMIYRDSKKLGGGA